MYARHGLSGTQLDYATQLEILASDRTNRAFGVANRYLSRRDRTEAEVRKRLEKAGYVAAEIEAVCARLVETLALNDRRYADEYVRARFSSRSYGPDRIRRELLTRGVNEAIVVSALEQLEETAVAERALALGQRRAQTVRSDPPHRASKKIREYLVRRGYSWDLARTVTEKALADTATDRQP